MSHSSPARPSPSRRSFLSLVGAASLGVVAAPRLVSAQATRPVNPARAAMPAAPLETVKLEDDLHVIMGAGGNIAVHTGGGFLTVCDCGIPQRATDVLAAVTALAPDAKRKSLISSHWHFDHTGGNELLGGDGFVILAHANCRANMSRRINFEDLNMVFEPSPEVARPVVTFGDAGLTLHAPRELRLTRIAPAHTDSDVVTYFPHADVLHTGDLFFNGSFPVIDVTTGGSLAGMIRSTGELQQLCTDKTRIIPGHGPMATRADLQKQLDLLTLCRERLKPFADRNASLDDVLKAAPLADLDNTFGRGFLRSPMFTRMAYRSMVASR